MRHIASTIALMLALVPAIVVAQQTSAPAATTTSKAQAYADKIVVAFNKKDPAAVAAMFTTDALMVGPDGTRVKGRKAIEGYFTTAFRFWGDFTYTAEVKEAHPLGNGIWEDISSAIKTNGPAGTLRSHLAQVLVPVGKEWQARFVSIGTDVALPGPPQPSAAK